MNVCKPTMPALLSLYQKQTDFDDSDRAVADILLPMMEGLLGLVPAKGQLSHYEVLELSDIRGDASCKPENCQILLN